MIPAHDILSNLQKMLIDPNDQLTDGQRENIHAWMEWFNSGIDFSESDLVQIDPLNGKFGGQFMVVTNTRYWGAEGYILIPTIRRRVCEYKVNFKNSAPVGRAKWVMNSEN